MKNRYECNDCGVVFNLEILEGADDDDEIYCPICSASLSDEYDDDDEELFDDE